MHMGQWKCLCLGISSRFFPSEQIFWKTPRIIRTLKFPINLKLRNPFFFFFFQFHIVRMLQRICALPLQGIWNLKGLQFDYWENWITNFIQAAGASLHSLLTPYSLLIYRSDNYLKYFPTARKFRAQQKNMSHKHQKNARNYFGVCCHACLFHRHHLFNTRRVQLFITSAAMA